jgi:hypothetical protein
MKRGPKSAKSKEDAKINAAWEALLAKHRTSKYNLVLNSNTYGTDQTRERQEESK